MLSDPTTSVLPASSRGSCATVVALSEHGSWSGTVWSSVSSSQRILSLWLERLSTDRIVRQWREAPSPLVVFGKRGNLDLVLAVDAAAEQLGLTAGLALAQARAMHPTLTAVSEDQTADARLLDAIAETCQRYTPLVAIDPPDGILLDIGGCAHLFGGEEKLRTDLLARMTCLGFSARIAIAATIGAAFAAARFGDAPIMEDATGDARGRLAPLPLAALRLPDETVAALARVGLKRIGDILDLPRSPLAARFGADLLRQLDRALGREDEPLTPRLPIAPYVAEKRIAAGTSRPVRDPQVIRALFVERLAALGDEIDPGFGFDLTRLSVLNAEPCPDEQIGFGTLEDQIELDRLIDRLSARLGRQRVSRLLACDSHIPELAAAVMPAQAMTRGEFGWDGFRRFRAEVG